MDKETLPLVITVHDREILRVTEDLEFTWGEIDPPDDAVVLARLITGILRGQVEADTKWVTVG